MTTATSTPAVSTLAGSREAARRARQRGLTLVELLVVVAILGLLSTVVVLNVLPARDRAAVQKARTDIASIETALQQYRLDNLDYPSQRAGLTALTDAPADLRQPDRYRTGGYIQRLPEDPWGTPYQYAYPGELGEFDVYSLGRDGRPGGEGLDADIGNWE